MSWLVTGGAGYIGSHVVRAFEKQGKSGKYFTLTFERIAKPAQDERWADADE